ncbi:MAG: Ribonuclease VapC [Pseudonocardia sp.]|uniref:hypothetical protein n=1 Tax=Pseudonocardia sp. TaxID=60912 RepID=UPI002610C7CE|nr:hypothetical protein [Pseudonocardia sp.]MCU1626909.1 Ribonuclease VapC [Pseudonocardia sp.]
MARVILATGVLVAAVRGRLDLPAIAEEDDVALPAVALAEYLTGVELDTDPARRAAQQAFLEELLAVTPIADPPRRSRATTPHCWPTSAAPDDPAAPTT